jgi:hypothetical protein
MGCVAVVEGSGECVSSSGGGGDKTVGIWRGKYEVL